ncbi:unnamed protein product [Rhizopus stolonifer]
MRKEVYHYICLFISRFLPSISAPITRNWDRMGSRDDIVLTLYADGFSIHKRKSYNQTIIKAAVMSLPLTERYQMNIMVLLGEAPEPSKSKNFHSLLEPMITELEKLESNGATIKVYGKEYHYYIYLVIASGDNSGVADLCNHAGPMCKSPCRICGIRANHSSGMYVGESKEGRVRILVSFQGLIESPGLKSPTLLTFLKSFEGPKNLGMDDIHLSGHNIARQIWCIISGEHEDNALALLPKNYNSIGSAMAQLQQTVPLIFEGSFKDVSKAMGHMRTIVWMVFLLFVSPKLVIEELDYQQSKGFRKSKKDAKTLKGAKSALLDLWKCGIICCKSCFL